MGSEVHARENQSWKRKGINSNFAVVLNNKKEGKVFN